MVPPSSEKSRAVVEAIAALSRGDRPDRSTLRDAVRSLLAELAAKAPGRSVEVRVPPYGAIQCVEGPRHTRGTPPNVVEMDPIAFVELATGLRGWSDAVRDGTIRASGIRADISHLFPITERHGVTEP
jgi:Bacterial SCP ortholog